MTSSVLVTGASGGVGAAVARRLVAHGCTVRRLSRAPQRLAPLPRTEPVQGGYDDPDALRRAADGVAAAFLVSLPGGPERVALHEQAVRAVRDAGVRHVVYLSFLRAGPESGFPQGRWHHETEQVLRDLLPQRWTAVRPSLYAQALLGTAGIVEDGVLRAPAGTGRIAPVDRGDVAPVIARILLDGSHRGETVDVTGPLLHDWSAIAAARGLAFADVDPSWFGDRLRQRGTAPHLVDGLLGLFADVRAGRTAVVSDAVTDVGGVLPHALAETGGRRLVRGFVAHVDGRRPEAAGAVVAPDYRQHNPGVDPGRAGLVAATEAFLAAAPDLVADVASLVEADDLVAATVRWTTGGASWLSHDLWRHDGRHLLEHWDDVDAAALGRRLRLAAPA